MTQERLIRRYQKWYATLLRLYANPFYERFGQGMEQTFNDLLRERVEEGKELPGYAAWMFIETFAGILKEHIRVITMHNKSIIRIALLTIFILLLPLVAMQFSDEVVWDLTDFTVAGILLFGAGLTFELIVKRGSNLAYKVAIGLAVAAALLLVWVNLAVGIIGNEGDPANLMYGVVLAVGFIGAISARFRAHGMARTLLATALVQALVAIVALIIHWLQVHSLEASLELLGINLFFLMLFVGSAWLFQRATRYGLEAEAVA